MVLSGIRQIDIVDPDTISISNLHRQFLFTQQDNGRPKAQAAAEALLRRRATRHNPVIFPPEEQCHPNSVPHHTPLETEKPLQAHQKPPQYSYPTGLGFVRLGTTNEKETLGSSVNFSLNYSFSPGDLVIRWHQARIEDFPPNWTSQFDAIVLGLDSMEARLHVCKAISRQTRFSFLRPMDGHQFRPVAGAIEAYRDSYVEENTPLVDGGTEGLRGNACLVLPGASPCTFCIISMTSPDIYANEMQRYENYLQDHMRYIVSQSSSENEMLKHRTKSNSIQNVPFANTVPFCTIAQIPRNAAHCVLYAELVLWPKLLFLGNDESEYVMESTKPRGEDLESTFLNKEFNSNTASTVVENHASLSEHSRPIFDRDNPIHVRWVYNRAVEWAVLHHIEPPSYAATISTLKTVIPAVSTTNAIVSGVGVGELLKFLTASAPDMGGYFLHIGDASVTGSSSDTLSLVRNRDCVVCGDRVRIVIPSHRRQSCTARDVLKKVMEIFYPQKLTSCMDDGLLTTIVRIEVRFLSSYCSRMFSYYNCDRGM